MIEYFQTIDYKMIVYLIVGAYALYGFYIWFFIDKLARSFAWAKLTKKHIIFLSQRNRIVKLLHGKYIDGIMNTGAGDFVITQGSAESLLGKQTIYRANDMDGITIPPELSELASILKKYGITDAEDIKKITDATLELPSGKTFDLKNLPFKIEKDDDGRINVIRVADFADFVPLNIHPKTIRVQIERGIIQGIEAFKSLFNSQTVAFLLMALIFGAVAYSIVKGEQNKGSLQNEFVACEREKAQCEILLNTTSKGKVVLKGISPMTSVTTSKQMKASL